MHKALVGATEFLVYVSMSKQSNHAQISRWGFSPSWIVLINVCGFLYFLHSCWWLPGESPMNKKEPPAYEVARVFA